MSIQKYRSHQGQQASLVNVPKHIAVIMDGNGRWAKSRRMSRTRGHRKGVEAAWRIVLNCLKHDIPVLTLFAFGQENWKRPDGEVRNLFRIFYLLLRRDMFRLQENNIRLRIVGDRTRLPDYIKQAMSEAEQRTAQHTALTLNIALNYSGKWDIVQAIAKAKQNPAFVLSENIEQIEAEFEKHLCFHGLPEPDLFIRTSGVQRLSNFILWDLAYAEIYFTQVLWPDFDDASFEQALSFFQGTERRFGLISEQVAACSSLES